MRQTAQPAAGAERRRLDNSGKPLHTQRSRATWLFEGEDVPVTEGSALARLLILPIPDSPRQPELMGRLQALMPRLPAAARGLVDHLLATKPWLALVAKYRAADLNAVLDDVTGFWDSMLGQVQVKYQNLLQTIMVQLE
jgi:hypothetical protein